MMITFERLKPGLRQIDYTYIELLLTELYGGLKTKPTHKQIDATVKDYFVAIAREETGHIVGMATLVINRQFTRTIAVVENVVVLSGYRNRAIGKGLMQMIECQAASEGAQAVDLITDHRRTPAVALYEKLGYEKREKINFRKTLA